MTDRTEYAFRPEWAKFLTPMFEEEVAQRMVDDMYEEGRVLKSPPGCGDVTPVMAARCELVRDAIEAGHVHQRTIASAVGLSVSKAGDCLWRLCQIGAVVRKRGAGGVWVYRITGFDATL